MNLEQARHWSIRRLPWLAPSQKKRSSGRVQAMGATPSLRNSFAVPQDAVKSTA